MVKKSFLLLIMLLLVLVNKSQVKAANETSIYVVYDEKEVKKGDIIDISIDIPAFADLFEVIIRYSYDENVMIPVSKDEEYFTLDNHSIFSSFVVNKKFDENVLYAEMMKESIEDGYYSSYKNNLCHLTFSIQKSMVDVTEYFNEENLKIYLFDNNHQIINYELKTMEKIKGDWLIEELEVDVFSNNLELNKLFCVSNRNDDQYLLFVDQEINMNVVSKQVLLIGLFDVVTGHYQTFSKIVNVVDCVKPTIKGDALKLINDYELETYDFYNQVAVSDNYDLNPLLEVNYYSLEGEHLNKVEAISYLKVNYFLNVGYLATDSSGNKSIEKIVKYQLIDNLPPIIEGPLEVYINDYDLNSYNINELFNTNDNLDLNPKIIISFFDYKNCEINCLQDALTVNNNCYLRVIAVDESLNESDELIVTVYLVDTTPPIITGEKDISINDIDVDDFNFSSLINISDDDLRKTTILYEYYCEEMVSYDEFLLLLEKGKRGMIKYIVYDYSQNKSEYLVNIDVLDTTPPIISVNVENDKIYKSLDSVKWNVTDNFDCDVIVNVYLNKQIYQGGPLVEGEYNLFIEAIDESGNMKCLNYNFIVSDAGVIENILRGNIKINPSTYVILVMSLTIVLVVVKIILLKKKKMNS